jgi:hypothetical protein
MPGFSFTARRNLSAFPKGSGHVGQGHVDQGMIRPKDASSKGRIVKGRDIPDFSFADIPVGDEITLLLPKNRPILWVGK